MKKTDFLLMFLLSVFINNLSIKHASGQVQTHVNSKQWSIEKANQWYSQQPWIIGSNYVPANAINPLEMWQADTFSPELIEKELAYSDQLGFNTMRIFLAYLPWKENPQAYYSRIDKFLEICARHKIRPMLVFFDDVWAPDPKPGKQPEPLKGIHNSGWVQCPGAEILGNPGRHKELKPFVQGIVKRYATDKRVLAWDLYNEPGNPNTSSYGSVELKDKTRYSLLLLKKVFDWAREINPEQPLTVDVWTTGTASVEKMSPIDRYAYEHSDIISFHCYSNSTETEKMVKNLMASKRPVICTEYMSRETGSTFQAILPIFRKYQVGAFNWGFVSGKSQTIYPWSSWEKPFNAEPKIWFHDIFRPDGTPFSQDEITFIQSLTK